METSAFYHRPESEFCYIYSPGHVHIRFRCKRGDVRRVTLIAGDPYNLEREKWHLKEREMEYLGSTDIHDYWLIDTDEYVKRLSYAFHVTGMDGVEAIYNDRGVYPYQLDFLTNSGSYFRLPYFHEVDRFKAPHWVKKTIWYQIFPERFANGDPQNDPEGVLPWDSKERLTPMDFYGGDLEGIIQHLDYLEDMGINGLYLTPIFKAPSNHKYDTTDYYQIDPHFGDKAIFKRFVDEAHRRGMRVMLDAVFNHIGVESNQWRDVATFQENSRFKDWFHIRRFPVLSAEEIQAKGPKFTWHAEGLPYETYSYTPTMPKINTHNEEVQKYLLDIATYWIREFDIDAWRLDVANEVDHSFWKKFNKACLDLKEDFYILGEIWTSSRSWLNGDEFHGVMNYSLVGNITDFFINKTIPPYKLASGVNEQLFQYRKQTNETMFNMLDSHDTPRIMTLAGGDKDLVKATMTFMFLQHGSPCLYYGTEIGMTGGADPQCRRCMRWDPLQQDQDLLSFTKDLIDFRRRFQPLLSYGYMRWQEIDDQNRVVAMKRYLGEDVLVAYFNQGDEVYTVEPRANWQNVFSFLAEDYPGTTEIQKNGFVVYWLRPSKGGSRIVEEENKPLYYAQ